jgi:PhnB protein
MFTPTVFSASGYPTVVSVLILDDVETASHFYERAFAFTKAQVMMHADGRVAVADMRWPGGTILLLSTEFAAKYTAGVATPSKQAIIRLVCDEVDALFAHAVAAGATALSPPQDKFWGERNCILADPYGHRWVFANLNGEYRPPPEGI